MGSCVKVELEVLIDYEPMVDIGGTLGLMYGYGILFVLLGGNVG